MIGRVGVGYKGAKVGGGSYYLNAYISVDMAQRNTSQCSKVQEGTYKIRAF